jgi:hypothetical protein
MSHGDFTALSYSFFLEYLQNSRKVITKTILKIEIRVKPVKIRGYLLNISVGNASTKAVT